VPKKKTSKRRMLGVTVLRPPSRRKMSRNAFKPQFIGDSRQRGRMNDGIRNTADNLHS